MKPLFILIAFISFTTILSGQHHLDVQGKARIEVMDDATALDSMFVVVLEDGTLAKRKESTLTQFQFLTISNDTVFLSGGGFVKLPEDKVDDLDADASNELQLLSIVEDTIFLSNGGFVKLPMDKVDDSDADITNEIQDLSLSGDNLMLSDDVSSVDLSIYKDNTDNQNLSISPGDVASSIIDIQNGTDITLSVNGGLAISESSSTITLTNSAPDQTVALAGSGISNVSGVYPNFTITSTELDGSTTNELQDLSLNGSILSLSEDLSPVDLSVLMDATDEQDLSIGSGSANSSVLEIENGAGVTLTVDGGLSISETISTITLANTAPDQTVTIAGGGISTITGVYPAFTITTTEQDGSSTNELQSLSLTDNTLSISDNEGSVDLQVYLDNTDEQELSASRFGDTLSLSRGGYLIIPGLSAANFGNVQEELNKGFSPLTLFKEGISLDSLYGKSYNGGLIFYIDTLDVLPEIEALIAAPTHIIDAAEWGCNTTDLNMPSVTIAPPTGMGAEIGDGSMNTDSIVMQCTELDIAAKKARAFADGSWYLPAANELLEMFDKLGAGAFTEVNYWSSTQNNASMAWYKKMDDASNPLTKNKEEDAYVHPIKSIYQSDLSVQRRLDLDATPKSLYDDGVPLDSLYGKIYEGGLIFYLNTTNGTGLVAAPSMWDGLSIDTTAMWGCNGTAITGADGSAIGSGQQNTSDILVECMEVGIAAELCEQHDDGTYSDWFLPSKDELNELYSNLQVSGYGDFITDIYISSTESSDTQAWGQDFNDGGQLTGGKEFSEGVHVRPIRAF